MNDASKKTNQNKKNEMQWATTSSHTHSLSVSRDLSSPHTNTDKEKQKRMGDHAERDEIVRSVRTMLQRARQRGETTRPELQAQILSIANSTCAPQLECVP